MKKNGHHPITLKDIAKETGYSVNTISRALRGKDDISEETRKHIKETANKLGYIYNALASSLRSGHSNTIAVIFGDVSNPHFGIMMKEIEGSARSYGYNSFLLNTNEDEELERAAIQSALNKSVDGIIICPSQHSNKNIQFLMDSGIPFVQLGRRFENYDANYVICNDELGGYQATKNLLDNGHKNILMLSGPSYISSANDRLAGYRRAHEEYGIEVQEALVREVPITSDGCSYVIDDILKGDIEFSAIFAFSDMIAWEAWLHLKQHGYRVPEDFSLIGFDHIQSRLSIPYKLSSISSYKARMSTDAVEFLVSLIKSKENIPKCRQVIDTELVLGETVRQYS